MLAVKAKLDHKRSRAFWSVGNTTQIYVGNATHISWSKLKSIFVSRGWCEGRSHLQQALLLDKTRSRSGQKPSNCQFHKCQPNLYLTNAVWAQESGSDYRFLGDARTCSDTVLNRCICGIFKCICTIIPGFSKKSDEFIIHIFQDVSLLRKTAR